MSTPLQNTESRKTADDISPGFYFPTDVDGNVLPLFAGGRPRKPTRTLSVCENKPEVMAKRRHLASADAELKVPHLSLPSASIQQHRLVRAKSAPIPRVTLTPAMQETEPPRQAPLFPCDASGAVLPLFHPSTSTPGSPLSRTATVTTSSGSSCTFLPCNASGAVRALSLPPVTDGSGTSVPLVAAGDCDDEEEEEDEDGDSAESVIEWIDEMLSGCGVVGEGFGRRERRRRGARGQDAREVLEWLEGLRFDA